MNIIACKVPLNRPMIHQASLDGLEGPARIGGTNEFGESFLRGQITNYYNTKFKMTPGPKGEIQYNGEVDIYDTEFNRKKIAAMVRHGDLKVLDADLQEEIMAQFPGKTLVSDAEFTEVQKVVAAIEPVRTVAKKNQIVDRAFRPGKNQAPAINDSVVSKDPAAKRDDEDKPDAE